MDNEQRLIVEGKDGYVISSIMRKQKIPFPKGYNGNNINKFIINAGGFSKIKTALIEELQSPNVSNIGIIVDANDVGAIPRFESLQNIIEETLEIIFPKEAILTENGFGFQLLDNLFIGIWIMPDNVNNGYLEHFISNLIPNDNLVWQFANEKIEEILTTDFCEFSAAKKQKALVHTYLALKESPGMPMGTSILANYFDATLPYSDRLVNWIKNTFVLEEK